MAKKRFESGRNAKDFAKRVNGKFRDIRDCKGAKSKFVVEYDGSIKQDQKERNKRNLDL